MSTILWRGDAAPVAQETRVTPANVEVGDSFTLTVNNKSVSYTAAMASVADVTAGLASAWNSSSVAELAEVTATDDSTHLTLMANTPGVPFAVSGSALEGGSTDDQSLTISSVTAAAGPRHWDTAANWEGGAVPTTGDHVYLEHSEVSIVYGLEQSAVTLASLNIAASFTGQIGLPRLNSSGAASYVEYRTRYLQVSATDLRMGYGSGEGSSRLQIDTGSNQTTITLERTGSAVDAATPALLWKGTHVSNALHVRGGSVGVALLGSEAASLSAFSQTAGRVEIGSGVTLGTLDLCGNGKLVTSSSLGTLDQAGGESIVLGSAAVGTINLGGGQVDFRSSGTITNLNVSGCQALVDFSHDKRNRSVTNCTLTRGEIYDPLRSVSYGNGIEPGGRVVGFEAA